MRPSESVSAAVTRSPRQSSTRTPLAGRERLRPTAHTGDQQRLLDLQEEVAALVRCGTVDPESNAHALVQQSPNGGDARSEPHIRGRAVSYADVIASELQDLGRGEME